LRDLIDLLPDARQVERTDAIRASGIGSTNAVQQHATIDCDGAYVAREIFVLALRRRGRFRVECRGFTHDAVLDRRLDLVFARWEPHTVLSVPRLAYSTR
jgi:hypothetical protein